MKKKTKLKLDHNTTVYTRYYKNGWSSDISVDNFHWIPCEDYYDLDIVVSLRNREDLGLDNRLYLECVK